VKTLKQLIEMGDTEQREVKGKLEMANITLNTQKSKIETRKTHCARNAKSAKDLSKNCRRRAMS